MNDFKDDVKPMIVGTSINIEKFNNFVNSIAIAMDLYEYQIKLAALALQRLEIQNKPSILNTEPSGEISDKEEELLSIEDIKKRIKYSKSPLEVKNLRRRLNELYKNKYR